MDGLRAVVLDVDGTLVDSERDGHRVAFNLAFEEFSLPYRWSPEEYGELLAVPGGQQRLIAFLTDQGVAEDTRDDLARRLHRRKTELFQELVEQGRIHPRTGVRELLDDLAAAGVRMSVATTGSRAWVSRLLEQLFGLDRFEAVITGEDAPVLKPDPAAYLRAVEEMSIDAAADVIAVEDSHAGLRAAKAAGLSCVVVVNDYTSGQDFSGADLVLDAFDGSPAALHDPFGVAPEDRLDVATLARVARCAMGADR